MLCTDINEERVNTTVTAITEAGGRAKAAVEIFSGSACQGISGGGTVRFRWAHVDCLQSYRDVPYLPVTELPLAEWQGSLDVNLTGIFLLLKNAIPAMATTGGGSITLMASQLAFAPKPGRRGMLPRRALSSAW